MKSPARLILCVFAFAFTFACAFIANAQAAHGTKEEAIAMTKKAVEHMKAVGKEAAFADFSAGVPPFKDRDLYVFVYDMTGKNLAHGANPKMIGKDLSELKDADGMELMKALIASAKASPNGAWVNYRWPNVVTKTLENKSTWLVMQDNVMVGVGAYR
jgi:cytochrome c